MKLCKSRACQLISPNLFQLSEEYIYQSEGFLSSMRAILQSIKDKPEYKKYIANYKQMVYKRNLTR